jgi:hypothetical protein
MSTKRKRIDEDNNSPVSKKQRQTAIVLAIVGSRFFKNRVAFDRLVAEWVTTHGVPGAIVSGEEPNGTDAMAKQYAKDHNIAYIGFPADWDKLKDAAGPIRNGYIVKECTHVLAFPSHRGSGTQNTIRKAKAAQKHITIHWVESI